MLSPSEKADGKERKIIDTETKSSAMVYVSFFWCKVNKDCFHCFFGNIIPHLHVRKSYERWKFLVLGTIQSPNPVKHRNGIVANQLLPPHSRIYGEEAQTHYWQNQIQKYKDEVKPCTACYIVCTMAYYIYKDLSVFFNKLSYKVYWSELSACTALGRCRQTTLSGVLSWWKTHCTVLNSDVVVSSL